MNPMRTYREMFVLLNDELRHLNKRLDDLTTEELRSLRKLYQLFGLGKCLPGHDSWDSLALMEEEAGFRLAGDYEDYLESEMCPDFFMEDEQFLS